MAKDGYKYIDTYHTVFTVQWRLIVGVTTTATTTTTTSSTTIIPTTITISVTIPG